MKTWFKDVLVCNDEEPTREETYSAAVLVVDGIVRKSRAEFTYRFTPWNHEMIQHPKHYWAGSKKHLHHKIRDLKKELKASQRATSSAHLEVEKLKIDMLPMEWTNPPPVDSRVPILERYMKAWEFTMETMPSAKVAYEKILAAMEDGVIKGDG